MPTIQISEYQNQTSGEPALKHQSVDTGVDGGVSEPFSEWTHWVRIHVSDGAASLVFGDKPKPNKEGVRMASDSTEGFIVHPSQSVAVAEVGGASGNWESFLKVLGDPKAAEERGRQLVSLGKQANEAQEKAIEAQNTAIELNKKVSARLQEATERETALNAKEKALSDRETAIQDSDDANRAAIAKRLADATSIEKALDARKKELDAEDLALAQKEGELAKRAATLQDGEDRLAKAQGALAADRADYNKRMAKLKELTT